MQDIPRNELLDKLAEGWKVRRKSWDAGAYIRKDNDDWVGIEYLLVNDWEGELPEPSPKYTQRCVTFAFAELKSSQTAFIRRKAWETHKKICFGCNRVTLSVNDILATDWEVWA